MVVYLYLVLVLGGSWMDWLKLIRIKGHMTWSFTLGWHL